MTLVNARIAMRLKASTTAGCSSVFLEIAVISRRVDEFVMGNSRMVIGASSGLRQAPSGSLTAVTEAADGKL